MLTVTPTRLGWARFSNEHLDGAVRFKRWIEHRARQGRVEFVVPTEVVIVGDLTHLYRWPRARVEAWANGVGRDVILTGLAERAGMAAHGVLEGDALERAEPARRAEWGRGQQAAEEQDAMLALIAMPSDGPKPDEFYAEVADVYDRAAVQSASPAVAVAEANGVSPKMVRAWVREARRRGVMPAGRRGAA